MYETRPLKFAAEGLCRYPECFVEFVLNSKQKIVCQNDGRIGASGELGKGCAEPTVMEKKGAPKGNGELILLVDDEEAVLNLVCPMLQDMGYRVLSAGTPAEALRLAKEHASGIDILVTDVVMPEMNGRDLASVLRTMMPRLKCLFISGYTADVIANRGILEEGVHFLQKPFTMSALAAAVQAALQ